MKLRCEKGIFQTNLSFVLFNGTMSRVYDITSYRQSDYKGDIKECKKEGFTLLSLGFEKLRSFGKSIASWLALDY